MLGRLERAEAGDAHFGVVDATTKGNSSLPCTTSKRDRYADDGVGDEPRWFRWHRLTRCVGTAERSAAALRSSSQQEASGHGYQVGSAGWLVAAHGNVERECAAIDFGCVRLPPDMHVSAVRDGGPDAMVRTWRGSKKSWLRFSHEATGACSRLRRGAWG
ncbi:hypothetical protein BS50DRAFT_279348 [Corynespora cassiicola Philippines]|uniref:Uncharacterized protein n=1 Tax=Corynespora cassiicola Philippines TaxID=1448308 RepID=A0A2T2P0R0_CORCC|nr:hypothetical protein BS50DRAFT_279348 [Corynespora cassiicola Philippines]